MIVVVITIIVIMIVIILVIITARKMKFSITDFFSKCDQIRRKLKKYVMENFIFLCSE